MRQAKRRWDARVFVNEFAEKWGKVKANTEDVNEKDKPLMTDFEKKLLEEARDEAKAEVAKSKAKEDTRIHQSTMETEDYSKERAPAKAMDKDDTRLSESKKKSEVGENTKKGVEKTLAVKDTRLSAEGMEKVDYPRYKEDDARL